MTSTVNHGRRGVAAAVTLATALVLTVTAARRLDPVPEGLRAQYFPNAEPGATAVLSVVDPQPSSDYLFVDWAGTAPESFTATWSGWLVAPREGSYAFGMASDSGASVEIDGRLVVDHGGARSSRVARGTVELQRGVHSVFIRYVHDSGVPDFAFLWARTGAPLAPVPAWAMRPRQITYRRFMTDRVLDASVATAGVGWLATLLSAMVIGLRPGVVRLRSHVIGDEAWPTLAWILAGSAVLNLVGLGWGLPGGQWVGDEIGPLDILDALSQRYSHGWFQIYAPLHYYVLTLAYTPALALDWLGLITLHTTLGHTLMVVSGRAVSVVMGAGILLATFLCGRRAFGWRAALFASTILALAAPFIYYAKTANVDVPYLFWLALSLVFYLRVLGGASLADYVCWAGTAAFAICTKDQAYAFCISMPVVVLYEMWRANRRAGLPHPLREAVTDRRVVAAAVTAVVVFALCHNIAFNATGFVRHVHWITGQKLADYRAFEPTIRGRLSLLGLTVHLVELTWGWPLFVVSVAGVIGAMATAGHRRIAVWLLVPVASYYLGFVNVVLYNYDRFVLPICLVLVQFGGFAIDRLTAGSASFRPWRLAGVGALFGYTLLYSGTVDALMVNDSRYAVEQWLASHVGRDDLVGRSGLPRYLPRLDRFRSMDIGSLETLTRARPAFFVLNADYTRSEPSDSRLGQVIGTLRSGRGNYRLVFRARSRSPWAWLPGGHPELVGDRLEPGPLSFLRNINPTIEVFERR